MISKQFTEYAEIYDKLFSATIDYKTEVEFHDKILKQNKCKTILEVGCGCGHRGKYFINKGYSYTGTDISLAMLKIAKGKYPKIKFFVQDVKKINIKEKFDAIIFLGKGSSYLTGNADLINALKSMKNHSKKLIMIESFSASYIIRNFKKHISWSKKSGNKIITRDSENYLITKNPCIWKRKLTYTLDNKKYVDISRLRAFTKEEFIKSYKPIGVTQLSFIENGDTLISIAKR